MTKILALAVLLVLVVSVGFSQASAPTVIGLRGLTSGTLFSGKAYVNSQSDTSQALTVQKYKFAYVRISALDSLGAAVVWYRPAITGSTFGDKVTIGTTSASANNSGYTESFALPATCLAVPQFQIGVTFAGSANGVTSATYKLDILAKP